MPFFQLTHFFNQIRIRKHIGTFVAYLKEGVLYVEKHLDELLFLAARKIHQRRSSDLAHDVDRVVVVLEVTQSLEGVACIPVVDSLVVVLDHESLYVVDHFLGDLVVLFALKSAEPELEMDQPLIAFGTERSWDDGSPGVAHILYGRGVNLRKTTMTTFHNILASIETQVVSPTGRTKMSSNPFLWSSRRRRGHPCGGVSTQKRNKELFRVDDGNGLFMGKIQSLRVAQVGDLEGLQYLMPCCFF